MASPPMALCGTLTSQMAALWHYSHSVKPDNNPNGTRFSIDIWAFSTIEFKNGCLISFSFDGNWLKFFSELFFYFNLALSSSL